MPSKRSGKTSSSENKFCTWLENPEMNTQQWTRVGPNNQRFYKYRTISPHLVSRSEAIKLHVQPWQHCHSVHLYKNDQEPSCSVSRQMKSPTFTDPRESNECSSRNTWRKAILGQSAPRLLLSFFSAASSSVPLPAISQWPGGFCHLDARKEANRKTNAQPQEQQPWIFALICFSFLLYVFPPQSQKIVCDPGLLNQLGKLQEASVDGQAAFRFRGYFHTSSAFWTSPYSWLSPHLFSLLFLLSMLFLRHAMCTSLTGPSLLPCTLTDSTQEELPFLLLETSVTFSFYLYWMAGNGNPELTTLGATIKSQPLLELARD